MAARKFRFTWDEIAYLDADHLSRAGVFAGFEGPINFDDCAPRAIAAQHDPVSDVLKAAWPVNDRGLGRRVFAAAHLERRPCRFGGARVYFCCPVCSRATLRLAVLDRGFACGRCGGVTWASRRETATQRLVRKANKLADRLKLENFTDPPGRPPRMRTRTYVNILAQLAPLKAEIERRAAQRVAAAPDAFSAMAMLVRFGL